MTCRGFLLVQSWSSLQAVDFGVWGSSEASPRLNERMDVIACHKRSTWYPFSWSHKNSRRASCSQIQDTSKIKTRIPELDKQYISRLSTSVTSCARSIAEPCSSPNGAMWARKRWPTWDEIVEAFWSIFLAALLRSLRFPTSWSFKQ